jgi:hypothetical protein
MPAGQNQSNFALNARLSAPRYYTWCKIQVITIYNVNTKESILLNERGNFMQHPHPPALLAWGVALYPL